MALIATNVLVHAAKRISGEIVIELGIGSNGFPAGVAVAVGAGNRKRAMGIGHLGFGAYAHTYCGAGATRRGIGAVAACRVRARLASARLTARIGR